MKDIKSLQLLADLTVNGTYLVVNSLVSANDNHNGSIRAESSQEVRLVTLHSNHLRATSPYIVGGKIA